jgi:tetratricopeptide (TPR) repeat protein
LERRFPADTRLLTLSLPSARAALELHHGNPSRALEALQPAARFEVGSLELLYLRGLAYLRGGTGKEAAEQFQKILDHRGVAPFSFYYSLAHLGLGRARVLAGDPAGGRKAYESFLALWKEADPGIPVFEEAKQEYARLN